MLMGRGGSSNFFLVLVAVQGLLILLTAYYSTAGHIVWPAAVTAVVILLAACLTGACLRSRINFLKPLFASLAAAGTAAGIIALTGAVFAILQRDIICFSVREASYFFGLPRVQSIFGNPNALGLFLFFSMASVIILLFLDYYRDHRCRLTGRVLKVFLAVQAVTLFLTFSRASFAAFALFMAIFLWQTARRFFSIAVLIITVLLFYCLNVSVSSGGFNELMVLILNGRVELWEIGFKLFLQDPYLGIGAGGWSFISGETLPIHNTYLQIAVELGILGLLTYLFSMVLFLRSLGAARVRSARSCPEHALLSGLYALSIGVFVHQLFESHLYYGLPLYLVYLIIIFPLALEQGFSLHLRPAFSPLRLSKLVLPWPVRHAGAVTKMSPVFKRADLKEVYQRRGSS